MSREGRPAGKGERAWGWIGEPRRPLFSIDTDEIMEVEMVGRCANTPDPAETY